MNAEQEPERRQSAQGSEANSPEPRFLIIGRIVRAHGVRGELRVELLTELPERLTWLERVYLSRDPDDAAPAAATVTNVRFHKGQALVTLAGTGTREQAEELRSTYLLVPIAEAIPLEDDEYYYYQLEGLAVVSDEGEQLGVIRDVLETGANQVFIVDGPSGELLLPNTEEVVLAIDLEAGQMTVHLLAGLR